MGSLSFDNFHARKRNAMVKLVKGKEIAVQLQTLLREPVQDRGPVSAEKLAFQIYRSFSDSLSELSSCTSDQIPAADGAASYGDSGSKKKRVVKDRRGCYKRRRTSDSWEKISPSMEDNYAWRKYGQKTIFGADYPRSYFRCTHKKEGCKALKQVQRIKGDEVMYQTTYLNHHTCNETLRAPPLVLDSDPIDPNLISFQTSNPSEQDKHGQFCINSTKKPLVVSSVKREECVSEDVSNEAKSTLEDPWHDITGLEYEPVWAPYQDEVESTTLHGLDMEVDQLCDIQNFKYFDQMY
ncbi:WRKY DNA-binding transcription factor 70-like isoform X1 [Salvia splendens]|uniref:WRKY DNA-binding transcription factor 70-like isoform X1 n=1 Tax=Salvia splendens TaxID=180675 RepID=UPI0011010325|nr:WRKY DNA-binding transcription factor 70-like isoform X1 [Salvia splendens]